MVELIAAVVAFLPIVDAGETPRLRTSDLCGLLEVVEPGEKYSVEIEGVFIKSRNLLVSQPGDECSMDIQPSTLVEFMGSLKESEFFEDLDRITSEHDKARVVVRGSLWGPKQAGEDDLSFPPMAAFANRTGKNRYGSKNWFRTTLKVDSILEVDRYASREEPWYSDVHPVRNPSRALKLLDSALPTYPQLARNAGIQGKVVVQVLIREGEVQQAAILMGDRVLAENALANINTWRFRPEVDRVITVAFRYRLEVRDVSQRNRVQVDIDLPRGVTIIGSAVGW